MMGALSLGKEVALKCLRTSKENMAKMMSDTNAENVQIYACIGHVCLPQILGLCAHMHQQSVH